MNRASDLGEDVKRTTLLLTLVFATLVLVLATSAVWADDPVATTVPPRPNPTEATMLNDVNMVPIIAATATFLGGLSVVAIRREWV